MLKKIEKLLLLSKKNKISIGNLKWNFSELKEKNGQRIINKWQDLFKSSTIFIDFQRSIKNNTIDQLLINHLKNTGQFISLKHLLQLYARSYIRNYRSIKSFTTELNNRLVIGTPEQHLQAFDEVTKAIFNSFSFSMKINLLTPMIFNYPQLSRLQKQRLLNMMLGLDYMSKQILQQYRQECKINKQIVFQNNNPNMDEEFEYLLNKIQNIHYLKDVLTTNQFNELITYTQYEVLLNKYFEKLQNFDSFLKILKTNAPHTIFISKIIFENEILVDNYKLRMIALYDNIFNSNENLSIFRKESVDVYVPQIMSFFNKNDRYILKNTLMKILSDGFDQEKNKIPLLKLCEKFNFIFKPLIYQQAIQIKSELDASMSVRNTLFMKEIYNKSLTILQKFCTVHNLSLPNVFLDDRQSDYLRIKFHRFEQQIYTGFENFFKDNFLKRSKVLSKLKKQVLKLQEYQGEQYQQIYQDELSVNADVKTENNKNEDELDQIIQQLKPETNISLKEKQTIDKSIKIPNPNYKENKGLRKVYYYYYQQGHQIVELKHEIINQVKQLIVIVESLATYFRYYKPSDLKLFKHVLNFLTPIIDHFICLPKILQSLLIIKFENQNKQYQLFNTRLESIMKNAQNQFNLVCANLEKICSQNSSFDYKFDQSYEKFRIEQLNPSHDFKSHTFTLPFLYHNESQQQPLDPKFKIKNFFSGRYALCQENIINNLRTDNLINLYCQSSEMKNIVGNILNQNLDNHEIKKFTKNYIDYPCFADFLVEIKQNQFNAIYVLDYSKFYVGIPDLIHQKIKFSQQYFKSLGYNIIQINYNDYTTNRNKIIAKLKGETMKEV